VTVAKASRYPQPGAVCDVLAETRANFCEHDGVPARCPMCRAAAEALADQGQPVGQEPTEAQPAEPPAAEDDPRATPWWQR
jgi:hypothetical protein